MFGPVDFARIEPVLTTPRGWVELTIIAACLAIGWLVDDRVWRARNAEGDAHRLPAGIARVVFPLTALVLLLVARVAFHRSGATVLIDVAVPLLIALAAIRMVIYGLRRLFARAAWLKTSERTAETR